MKDLLPKLLICPDCFIRSSSENTLLFNDQNDPNLICNNCDNLYPLVNGAYDLIKNQITFQNKFSKVFITKVNLLEFFMHNLIKIIDGPIIDIGAGKRFRKNLEKYKFILEDKKYIAMDIGDERPLDFLSNAEVIPIKSNTMSAIFMFELLEHVVNPFKVMKQVYRILKNDGVILASVPFLHSYHGSIENFDNYRFTWQGIRYLFKKFQCIYIQPKMTWIETRQFLANPLYNNMIMKYYYRIVAKLLNPIINSLVPHSWRQSSGYNILASNTKIFELEKSAILVE